MAPSSQDERAKNERIVVLGRICSAFGVAGWVKVESYTDPPGNLLKYSTWLLHIGAPGVSNEWTPKRPIQGRMVTHGIQAQLEGVGTREQAEALRNVEIGVPREELPRLPPGEFYWDDLIGLEARSPEGERLGEIVDIRAAPAHPLMRLLDSATAGGKPYEAWVPLVRERIREVDLSLRRAVIDWRRDW